MSYSGVAPAVWASLPPGLAFLASPIATYFNSNPPYNNVMLQALIFTPPPCPPRILLLQRAWGAAPHAFSNFWQVPSGKPVDSDLTMLHALSRIVREQTGLELSYVAMMAGSEVCTGDMYSWDVQWMRMLFIVEVAELASMSLSAARQTEGQAYDENEPGCLSAEQASELKSISVRMNPDKHQLHAWATEDDLKEFANAGLYPTEETVQYQVMLGAFAQYKRGIAHMENLRQTQHNSVLGHDLIP